MQTDPGKYGGDGPIGAGIAIARDEGAGALVQARSRRAISCDLGGTTSVGDTSAVTPQGAAPTLFGYAVAGSLAFGLTDTLSRVLKAGPRYARDALEIVPRLCRHRLRLCAGGGGPGDFPPLWHSAPCNHERDRRHRRHQRRLPFRSGEMPRYRRDSDEIPTRSSAHLARSRAVSAQVRIRGVSTGAPAGETLASLLDEGGGGIGGVGVLFRGLGPILLKEVMMTT